MDLFIFPGVQDQDHVAYIQCDDGSQDPYPGLQEKSINPFCISFGKACSEYGTHSVHFWENLRFQILDCRI